MIREAIKQSIKEKGITVKSMCIDLKIRQATVSDYLNWKTDVLSFNIEKILVYLEIRLITNCYIYNGDQCQKINIKE